MQLSELNKSIVGKTWHDAHGKILAKVLKYTDGTVETTFKGYVLGKITKNGEWDRTEDGKVKTIIMPSGDAVKGYKFLRINPDPKNKFVFIKKGEGKGAKFLTMSHEDFVKLANELDGIVEKSLDEKAKTDMERDDRLAAASAKKIMESVVEEAQKKVGKSSKKTEE